jgi:PTH2 family peptidyl-tRNA hydrolase
MKRIKLLVRKNLKMSEGKIAAQCVHAALGLNSMLFTPGMPHLPLDGMESVVCLQVSDKKFNEEKDFIHEDVYIVQDAGYTEIPAGTETVIAFLEDDPRGER